MLAGVLGLRRLCPARKQPRGVGQVGGPQAVGTGRGLQGSGQAPRCVREGGPPECASAGLWGVCVGCSSAPAPGSGSGAGELPSACARLGGALGRVWAGGPLACACAVTCCVVTDF